MNTDSENRKMLLTGISGNIGKYVAEAFVIKGWIVVGLDKSDFSSSEKTSNIHFHFCDLTDFNGTEKKLTELNSTFGAFDVVVNCAGKIANAPLVSISEKELKTHSITTWNDIIVTNLYTTFYVSSLCIKNMIMNRRKGVIINISSIIANGNAGQAAYSAAKSGVQGLTQSIAKEFGGQGIRAVCIAPGFFDTASTHQNISAEKLEKLIASIPLKRLGHLSDIVKTIDFVIDTEYVNGKVIELDGGLTI